MINILDHGTGNLTSIINCLKSLNVTYQVAYEPNSLVNASHIIIPGVGHFKTAINKLRERQLDKAVIDAINRRVPILGICLGMQILYEYSEEGMSKGLGVVEGVVIKKSPSNIDIFKIPNVGWLGLEFKKKSCLFHNINPKNSVFYFANSYAIKSENQTNLTSTYTFDDIYIASIEQDNIYGTQFHPEKSGEVGYQLINNFLNIINIK